MRVSRTIKMNNIHIITRNRVQFEFYIFLVREVRRNTVGDLTSQNGQHICRPFDIHTEPVLPAAASCPPRLHVRNKYYRYPNGTCAHILYCYM